MKSQKKVAPLFASVCRREISVSNRKTSSVVTVLIADDHSVLRKGLKVLIEEESGISVCGEAADGQEALDKIMKLTPDVAILDIDMPVRSGLDVAAELKKRGATTRLIALSMHDEEKIFDKAMDVGFRGFILKDGAVTDIVDAIRAVLSGKHYISPVLSTYVLSKSQQSSEEKRPTIALLTQSERKVLHLISENKSTKEIAEELFVSVRTIDSHRANITAKLGLKGPNALLRFALDRKGKI